MDQMFGWIGFIFTTLFSILVIGLIGLLALGCINFIVEVPKSMSRIADALEADYEDDEEENEEPKS